MGKIIHLLFLILFCYRIYGQPASGSAPNISTFRISSDLVGNSSNNVNLYTGDVTFSLPLVSVSSPTGLESAVAISYNSVGVLKNVRTWNLDAPTSSVGLGWSFSFPKIISDHKSTGTIIDDEYFLSDGASTNKLFRIGSGSDAKGTFYTYKVEKNPYWQVKFYSELSSAISKERWEIVTDDGTMYVYGDASSTRKTVQYMVRWDNWIGNSSVITGQSGMAFAWNLSEVVNLWGQKLVYEYFNQNNPVGTNGISQTEASYLKSILNPEGIKIELNYALKQGNWYTEPHTENAVEPDAYQEFYERYLLDFVKVINTNNNQILNYVDLNYDNLVSSKNINKASPINKMILKEVIELPNALNSQPQKYTFDYYTSTNSLVIGHLWKVTNPTLGTVQYEYNYSGTEENGLPSALSVGFQNRIAVQSSTISNGREPMTWFGEDYVLIAWRSGNSDGTTSLSGQTVELDLAHWDGKWNLYNLGEVSNVELEGSWDNNNIEYKNFKVIVEKNYCAVQHVESSRMCKTYFFSKQVEENGLFVNWKKNEFVSNVSADTDLNYSMFIGGNSFVLSGFYKGTSAQTFLFDGENWIQQYHNNYNGYYLYTAGNNYFIAHDEFTKPGRIFFNFLDSEGQWNTRELNTTLRFTSSGISYWYYAPSFVVSMAKDNHEFIYRWTRDYNTFFRDLKDSDNENLFGFKSDDSPVYIVDNSLVGIDGTVARFTGQDWRTSQVQSISDNYGRHNHFGNDFVIYALPPSTASIGMRKTFNANFLWWSSATNLIGSNQKLSAGSDSFFYDEGFYFRNTDGSWSLVPFTSSVGMFKSNFSIYGSTLYINTGHSGGEAPNLSHSIYKVRNGRTMLFKEDGFYSLTRFGNLANTGYGSGIVASFWKTIYFNGYFSSPTTSIGASTIFLSKVLDPLVENEVNETIERGYYDVRVKRVVINDGVKNKYVSYNYSSSGIRFDPQISTAYYSSVDVIEGSDVSLSSQLGYTRFTFSNQITNPMLDGTLLKKEVFNANNILQASVINNYSIKSSRYTRSYNGNIGLSAKCFEVRLDKVETLSDGKTSVIEYTYDDFNGKPKTIRNYTLSGNSKIDFLTTNISYGYEFYPTLISKNILSIAVFSEAIKNSKEKINSEAKTLKFWGTLSVPVIHRTYVWDGFESNEFTAWNEGVNPGNQWRLISRVTEVDANTGLIKETSDVNGKLISIIWDNSRKLPIATVKNAAINQIAYYDFESQSSNFSNDAFSGLKSSSTSINVSLPSSGTFILSWWEKQPAGIWQYNEQIITTNLVIGGNGNLIDEVRLIPQNADMITYNYDARGNKITECNSNNECLYYEYDEYDRLKIVRDSKRNILELKIYKLQD